MKKRFMENLAFMGHFKVNRARGKTATKLTRLCKFDGRPRTWKDSKGTNITYMKDRKLLRAMISHVLKRLWQIKEELNTNTKMHPNKVFGIFLSFSFHSFSYDAVAKLF